MKRLILATAGTVAGLAALLSFKTQTHPLTNAGALPSASAEASSGSTAGSGASAAGSGSDSGSAPSSSTSRNSSKTSSAPKTYIGQAVTTRYGIVQVKATVANSKITDVAFVQLTAFDGRSQQINSYAGPLLLQETISQQSARVDTISGATYTSDGYRQSLQSALDQAGLK